MKDIIRRVLFESLLERMKEPIGRGKDHVVYDYEGDPTKVIKVAWGSDGNRYDPTSEKKLVDIDKYHIGVFQDNPDLFAKVYKVTDRYAIIEKLDTSGVRNDQKEIYDIVSQIEMEDLDFFNEHDAINRLYWLSANREGFHNDLIRELVQTGLFFQSGKLQLYIDFIGRIINSPLGMENKNLDVSDTNIGYNKDGGLRLLDF